MPDIRECKVKWALGSVTTNKATGGDGIPGELFQILKDNAVKVLHSICQQIYKTQQWSQAQERSVFIPVPKKGNASPSLAAKNIIHLISVLTIWWCPCVESSLVLLKEAICYDQCFQEDLRVPWTARKSIQSIPMEISPEYSLEGLMLKHQYFSHVMWRSDSFEKIPSWKEGGEGDGRGWGGGTASLTRWTWVLTSCGSW